MAKTLEQYSQKLNKSIPVFCPTYKEYLLDQVKL